MSHVLHSDFKRLEYVKRCVSCFNSQNLAPTVSNHMEGKTRTMFKSGSGKERHHYVK